MSQYTKEHKPPLTKVRVELHQPSTEHMLLKEHSQPTGNGKEHVEFQRDAQAARGDDQRCGKCLPNAAREGSNPGVRPKRHGILHELLEEKILVAPLVWELEEMLPSYTKGFWLKNKHGCTQKDIL